MKIYFMLDDENFFRQTASSSENCCSMACDCHHFGILSTYLGHTYHILVSVVGIMEKKILKDENTYM